MLTHLKNITQTNLALTKEQGKINDFRKSIRSIPQRMPNHISERGEKDFAVNKDASYSAE